MAEQNSIRCIQLPLVEWQLILPNVAVAEIIGYSQPQQAGEGWFKGLLSWRGAMVPVISVDEMCKHDSQNTGSRTRIAIVYNLSGDKKMPYIGIILQDIPRAYLAEEDRMQSMISTPDCEYIVGRADMLMENLMIPDLDAIMAAVKEKYQKALKS